jgi:hypothetical protein
VRRLSLTSAVATATFTNFSRIIFARKDGIKKYLIWDTVYTTVKLADEVSSHGFKVKAVFDDVCGSPYTGEAETLCAIMERSAE